MLFQLLCYFASFLYHLLNCLLSSSLLNSRLQRVKEHCSHLFFELLPLSHGDDVSDLVKLLLVMPLIDSLVDLFLDLVKVLVDAAHQVFQVLLQLSVVGFFSEGKLLHV